ncbi:RANBP2 [Cordylochernes scorpioides]|uniref:RANBP2 n=1 Tax=Cordylochernes scorpioides TaxID=51811 RepID=A0ABY6L8M7_9ARAC|nr:RANBP2 [Cordylochernes scorpioides]
MRRDQVHKVVCNHLIVEGTQLSAMATSNNSLCWVARDFSEDPQGTLEKFAIRFKNYELKEKFEKVYNECLQSLTENKPLPGQPSERETEQAVASIQEPTSCENLRAQLSRSEEREYVMVDAEENASAEEEDDYEEETDDDMEKMIMLEDEVMYSVFDNDSNAFKSAFMNRLSL